MKKKVKVAPVKTVSPAKSFNKLLLPAVIVVTAIVYHSSIGNEFTNWDDPVNVTENADIRKFHGDSLGPAFFKMFAASRDMVMYAPLTRLSYGIQYNVSQLNPQSYHFTNLILHLLNCTLVFGFIWLLTRQQWVASLTALLFGIHPMHIESVAWITGRIDVLYTVFYLASLCTYLLYLQKQKWRWYFYIMTFVLFVLADFTKAAAVTLPVVFMLLDYFLARKITWKAILEKVPFLLLSLVFGYLAIYVQTETLSADPVTHYNFSERVLFASYALLMYLWKLFVPINLSCFYRFPVKQASGLVKGLQIYPVIFYLSPLLIAALGFLIYKAKRFGRDVWFGVGFFLVNVALVLPFLAARSTIIADRYSYVSYVGFFFIMARWLCGLWDNQTGKFQSFKIPLGVTLVLFLLWCSYLSAVRCNVWHDSITLWSDAIIGDSNCSVAFYSRGLENYHRTRYDEAIKDYNEAIRIRPEYAPAYYNRGIAYNDFGKYQEAIKDYDSAILINRNYAEAYHNRGTVYLDTKQYESAIKDFDSAIRIKPAYTTAYNNRGIAYNNLAKYNEAIKDYDSAIAIEPNYAESYNNRGYACHALGNNAQAIKDYTQAILINPNYALAYYNRGITYNDFKKYNEEIKDYDSAIAINPNYIAAYNNRGFVYHALGKNEEAIRDFDQAILLKPDYVDAYRNRYLTYLILQKYQLAMDDAIKAKQFGVNIDPGVFNTLEAGIKKSQAVK